MKGKTYSKGDFTKDLLPLTRKAQFLDWLKMDYGIFLKIGLTLLLFAIPMIGVIIFRAIYLSSLEPTTDLNVQFSYIVYEAILNLAILLTSLIFTVGVSGISRIYRLMSWNEPSMFKADFFQGVKDNYKNLVLIPVILLGSYVIINFGSNYLGLMLSSGLVADIVNWSLIAILVFVLVPPFAMSISMNSYYSNSFANNFKNSFHICAHHYFPIIIAPIFVLLTSFLLFIPNPIILFISLAALFIFILPIILFSWRLLCLSYFDKYINKDYKEYLFKGLKAEGETL